MAERYLFTSESVTEGHPDKVADQISDGILDEIMRQDPSGRVAVECLTTTGMVVVAGEVTTKCYVDVQNLVRNVLKEIGYDKPEYGFCYKDIGVITSIHEQSPDISIGVSEGQGAFQEQGAGDQGLMFGFATNETPEFMPLPIVLAHKLTRKLSEARKNGTLQWLRPDGKSQVTVEYEGGKPKRVDSIVISAHHDEKVSRQQIEEDIKREVITPVCGEWADSQTKHFINATGAFTIGGPPGDTGLTGRKIIVDTYGGHGSHGGGAFSGKDPSKVDRSASYMARYIAKNLVAAGLADKCEVQLAYCIGVSEPVSVLVNTYGTNRIPEERITELVRKVFPLKPKQIIEHLKLRRPIYRKTAAYGHFGRDEEDFTWEKTDKVPELKRASETGEVRVQNSYETPPEGNRGESGVHF